MGLSIAIAGAIVMLTIIFVLFAIPNVVTNIFSIGDSSLKASDLRESISQTSTQIMSLSASSGSDIVQFSLANNGTEKLWDYDKFTLLITYDADIGGVETKVTEEFSYDAINSFGINTAYLVPEEIESGGWQQENGCPAASAWECIFETPLTPPAPDDGDNIGTAALNNADQDQVEFRLTNTILPIIINDVFVHYTYGEEGPNDAADPDLIVSLCEGINCATTIATWTEVAPLPEPNPAPPNFGVATRQLTDIERGNIGIYDDLTLEFIGDCAKAPGPLDDCAGGGNNDRVFVSWGIVEVQGINAGSSTTWVINDITNDIFDPRIVNNEESANIVAKLSNQVFASGDVIVLISTDNGVIASSAISAS